LVDWCKLAIFPLYSTAVWWPALAGYSSASAVESLLWQSIVVFTTELHGTSPTTVCESTKFLVAIICVLPDVINCQFREFTAALLRLVHFLSLDQQSGIHCPIICAIQRLTPNSLGKTGRRICSPDIRSINAMKCYVIVLYKSTCTYLLTVVLQWYQSLRIYLLIDYILPMPLTVLD